MDLPKPGVRIPFEGIGKLAGKRFTAEVVTGWKNYPLRHIVIRGPLPKVRVVKRARLSEPEMVDYFRNLERAL